MATTNSIRIEVETYEKLKKAKKTFGNSICWMVSKAVEKFLNEKFKKEKI